MQQIHIRPALSTDAPLIAQAVAMAMGDEAAKNYCGEQYIRVLTEIARAENTQYSHRHALIATVDNTPAGAIVGYDGASLLPLRQQTLAIIHRYNPSLILPCEETEAGEFYLDSIAVLPSFQGLGIGKQLVETMRNQAFSLGHKRVGLLVDTANPNAERLYRRIGFTEVGTKDFFGHTMHHLQAIP